MSPAKRQKLSPEVDKNKCADHEGSRQDEEMSAMSDSEAGGPVSEDARDSPDTEDEIEAAKMKNSRHTAKRKIRATAPSAFGATLQSLLSTDAPSALPLSLKPSIARKRNDEKLELKAKKVLQVEKKEKEDKGRIKNVIGGWGGESERTLRKVAQRGVVKLFNAIQQSQANAANLAEETKASRGKGKPTLPAPIIDSKGKGKTRKDKDNIIGRGKDSAVDKDDFFNMIRSGSIVSKA
ncbi:Rrp15p-domain-containing protein [Cyathus striatus]|nr:Rrp15p-domain-containing protein [Cyathus striatus]